MAKFIGEILVERGLASRDQIEQALHLQSQSTPHKRLGQILIDQGILSQNQIRLPSSERESLLLRLIARINSTLNTESLLATIMQAAEDVMGAQASSLFLIDRETGDLLVAVPTGAVRAEILGRRIPAGLGLCGWVASHGEPLVVHEARKDPRFFGDIDEKFQTIDVIAVPLRNPGGNVIGVLEVGGTVIGFAASTRYHSEQREMRPGQLLMMYTDGVTEARNPAQEFFGEERLHALVLGHGREDAQTFARRVHDSVLQFTEGAPQADDITLLVTTAG
ncbi:MAG TPA: GAF domain-containing SpoIIE family protein phosphatase [Candidatus Polarisedimenticolia bacterium]